MQTSFLKRNPLTPLELAVILVTRIVLQALEASNPSAAAEFNEQKEMYAGAIREALIESGRFLGPEEPAPKNALSWAEIMAAYEHNEDVNAHSENYVLLAEALGKSPRTIQVLKDILAKRDSGHGLSADDVKIQREFAAGHYAEAKKYAAIEKARHQPIEDEPAPESGDVLTRDRVRLVRLEPGTGEHEYVAEYRKGDRVAVKINKEWRVGTLVGLRPTAQEVIVEFEKTSGGETYRLEFDPGMLYGQDYFEKPWSEEAWPGLLEEEEEPKPSAKGLKLGQSVWYVFETQVAEVARDPDDYGLSKIEKEQYAALYAAIDWKNERLILPKDADSLNKISELLTHLSNVADAEPEQRGRREAGALATLGGKVIRRLHKLRPERAEARPPAQASEKSIQDKRAQNFAANSYLNRFFREKEIPTVIFEKTSSDGTPHILDTEVVIEHIGITRGEEREKIEDIIRKIDFNNGDLNHFFGHLAQAIAEKHADDFGQPLLDEEEEEEPAEFYPFEEEEEPAPKTFAAEKRRQQEPEPSDDEMMARMSAMMDKMMGGE